MAKLPYAERLDLERDRDGKPPLTPEERLAKLIRIRDGSLIWVEMCVAAAKSTGSGAAWELYDHACESIAKIEDDASAGENTRLPWGYTSYPLDGTGPEVSDSVN